MIYALQIHLPTPRISSSTSTGSMRVPSVSSTSKEPPSKRNTRMGNSYPPWTIDRVTLCIFLGMCHLSVVDPKWENLLDIFWWTNPGLLSRIKPLPFTNMESMHIELTFTPFVYVKVLVRQWFIAVPNDFFVPAKLKGFDVRRLIESTWNQSEIKSGIVSLISLAHGCTIIIPNIPSFLWIAKWEWYLLYLDVNKLSLVKILRKKNNITLKTNTLWHKYSFTKKYHPLLLSTHIQMIAWVILDIDLDMEHHPSSSYLFDGFHANELMLFRLAYHFLPLPDLFEM